MKCLGSFLITASVFIAANTHACDLHVESGWVRTAPPGASVLVGYALLRNGGAAPIAVKGFASPQFASVEIHESQQDGDIARMRRVDSLEIPASGEVRLVPNGKHLMLMRPVHAIENGSSVELIVDACDSPLKVNLPVRDDESGQDHSHAHHH
jgi:copper(I)-binding protein